MAKTKITKKKKQKVSKRIKGPLKKGRNPSGKSKDSKVKKLIKLTKLKQKK